MRLSLFYFVLTLLVLLSAADPTESDSQCPTSRRLLLFGGSDAAKVEKKSPRVSSSAKTPPPPSSPPKYARSSDSSDLVVYVQPDGSTDRPHKGRSYAHLLKPKLHGEKDKRKTKRSTTEQKKQSKTKNAAAHKSSATTKSQELVAVDEEELARCRALLQLDAPGKPDEKKTTPAEPVKTKDVTEQAPKDVKKKPAPEPKAPPVQEKKPKVTKPPMEVTREEKKPVKAAPTEPIKVPTPQTTAHVKAKREKPPAVPVAPALFTTPDDNEDDNENQTNSVVNRALHFVKNMFQLSDDSLTAEHTHEDPLLDLAQEQQHHHHSRKLLSFDEHPLQTSDDWSYVAASVSKRQLLAAKTNKRSATSKAADSKEKKVKSTKTADADKPKVGWAYRYRISRYLNAQKMNRAGTRSKPAGKGAPKSKDVKHASLSKSTSKKTSSKADAKVTKRKLLTYPDADDSQQASHNDFIPKRQLLAAKAKRKDDEPPASDERDQQSANTRRQTKSLDELTDPVAIVRSYDRGLFKPRVGWQFRYRVSRYIDSLRDNIREDQERLKAGLQAIKRKTPQELSGRRKRVLDKPFAPDADELKRQQEAAAAVAAQENKPHVGWTYRYRISRMNEAKKRGEYVDEQEEKRKARAEQKKKPAGTSKSRQGAQPSTEGEAELDSELRQISDEGRRVGWAYRYRIRRKLDELKRRQAETGKSFDLGTLGGKREKKTTETKTKSKAAEKKTAEPVEQKPDENKKSVGWEYRYRVSKMQEAQKRNKSKRSKSKASEKVPAREKLDPQLAKLTPEQRAVGWQYRYRIRKKLDSTKETASGERQSGKRDKKSPTKRKSKEKMIDKVEESIEKILNIDDIDETPFMEYFRRGSSYVLHGLAPAARKSICLLPMPVRFSFCDEDGHDPLTSAKKGSRKSRRGSKKRLKTKKEHRAKQFIHAPPTKLGAADKATERRVDEAMRRLYKKPSLPPPQTPSPVAESSPPAEKKKPKKKRARAPKSVQDKQPKANVTNDKPAGKIKIGVDSKKNKTKKQFQIIGKQFKVKSKSTPRPPVHTPTTTVAPVIATITEPPRLRSISEIIQEDAANILGTDRRSARTPEELKAEVEEANEILLERAKKPEEPIPTITRTTPTTTTMTEATMIESVPAAEDEDADPTDDESKPAGEKIAESVHDVLELAKDTDSA